jgi:hypothetical protein
MATFAAKEETSQLCATTKVFVVALEAQQVYSSPLFWLGW